MNKDRRNRLQNLIAQANWLRATLEAVRDEEQEAYDNMPEGIQESDRGDAMVEGIQAMEDAMDSLDEAISSLETAAE